MYLNVENGRFLYNCNCTCIPLNFDKRWGETIFDGWSILRISLKALRLMGFKFSDVIILFIIDC
jgi:hypothetical protein